MDSTISGQIAVLVSLPVLLETEWVLRSRYELPRESILGLFRAALEARELTFEDEAAVEEALYNWQGQSERVFRLPDRGPKSAAGVPLDGHV